MPMSKSGLATELRAKIISKYGQNPADSALLNKFCEAISEAVIDHIIANTIITLIPGDIPVQVSIVTGAGATLAATLNGKIT